MKARKGGDKDTLISFFYREFTGGISGLRTRDAQRERLTRMLNYWRELDRLNLDCMYLGDMNLCAMKWADPAAADKDFIDTVKDTQITCTLEQIVNNYTRMQKVEDELSKSAIDHV